MSNLRIKTGTGADAYLSASGAGTDADPHVMVQELDALTISSATGLIETTDATTVVAAPAAGNRLVVDWLALFVEEATPCTVTVSDGSTALFAVRLAADGDGVVLAFERGKEVRLTAATALKVTSSAESSVRWSVRYRTEAA